MDAGHFKHGVLDFDEINVHCQCKKCNKWMHGNLGEYSIRLIRKYGLEAIEELHRRAKEATKGETWDYDALIKKYDNRPIKRE